MKPSMMPSKSPLLTSQKIIAPAPEDLLKNKKVIAEPLGAFAIKDVDKEPIWGKKRTVNGYKRNFTPHALHRMKERGITRTDIKNATHNIRMMYPLDDGRWKLVSKDNLVIIGLLEENPDTNYFVILTAYRPPAEGQAPE